MRFDRPSRRASRLRLFLLVSLLLGLAWLAMAFFRVGTAPAIEITAERGGIGREPSPITVNVEAPSRGLEDVRVELLQGGRSESLAEATFKPRAFWAFWGPRTQAHRFTLPIGQSEHTDLEEGEATIRVVASRAGSWLRHPEPTTTELSVPVRLKPPILSVESRPNIARQGGSGLLLYRVGEAALEEGGADGVEVGSWFFSGRPLPGADDPTQRFCLFALPYDLESGEVPKLAARDALGNSSSRTFLDTFQAAPLRYDEINISDSFLDKVVPEILEQTPSLGDKGSRIENYLAINGGLRAKNANQLIELARASSPERLWQGAFLQLPSSQVTSTFADRRTYSYQGREVDRQDHLGYDLASTRRASVPAANGGTVVLAEYFGIYGNTVVIDHGWGLLSLYSHLSSISVSEGQGVARGEEVGRTGDTGLAAGDHLHFTMLLGGLPVDPLEWWDPAWITKRLDNRLEATP